VDGDLRLLGINRAARVALGRGDDAAQLLMKRGGEALHCVLAAGPGGCGRQDACTDCVIRRSVGHALEVGAVRRARAFMRLGGEDPVDVCLLVSASPLADHGATHAVLTLEDVSDVQLKEEVIRSERALRDADARAASLARFPEENPDPVLRVAADGVLAYANKAARVALGHMRLEVGRDVPAELARDVRRALEGGRRVWSELSCGDRIFALSFMPVGREVNLYGHDVTEEKRTLAELAAQKERLRVTLSSIGDAVVATDESARITLVNGVAEKLTGWSAGDAIGRRIDEVFKILNEDTREAAVNPVERALREGVIVGLANHTSLVARDGSERPIADSAAPIRDAQGRTTGVVLVFRDQTSERASEKALRESERRIRAKLDAILSPEGDISNLELGDVLDAEALRSMMLELNRLSRIPMAIIDVRGKVLVGVGWQDICTKFHRVHPETCKHCIESDTCLSAGVPPGEIRLYKCKNNMWDVATPVLLGGHHAGNVFMGQFFFEDEPLDYDVFRSQAARYGFDEGDYLAALEAVPRLSRESVATGMQFFLKFAGMVSQSSYSNLKLARSAAERESLLTSLRESKEHLEEADRRKNEFLAVLSHELRNPLAPIRNSLYLLDRAPPGSHQATRARSVIDRQTKHLSRLVDDLLDVTRISHGKISLNRSRIDVRDVVRRTCDDNRSAFEQGEIEMHLDLPFGPVWIDADETRVSQALGNLIQNAAKFTPTPGRVMVGVAAREDRAEIVVRDTGVGIEPRDLERMFQPFAQADQGLARTQGGLGLGLALVKGLVELHGGFVRAHSDGAGHGSEFVITLPLCTAVPPADLPNATSVGTRRKLVLIVEDSVDAGQSLADILELEGHRTVLARSGATAIAIAREIRPDVVLCDIGLPDLSGFEVARTIRADAALRSSVLIALSGYAQPEDRRRAIDAGFDAHVAKPPDVEALKTMLAKVR
jgi:PAS domain S-box-containing protein